MQSKKTPYRSPITIPLIVTSLQVFLMLFMISSTEVDGQVMTGREWEERFDNEDLDSDRWQITREGNFKESTIDVIDVDPGKPIDRRLRFLANTIGTNDHTVKYHGVRMIPSMDFQNGITLSIDLDWNQQTNGSYLTGAVFLSPTITNENPEKEPNWVRLEYVGVPPGQNARATISIRLNGHVQWLHTEGWPDQQRTGRKVGLQHLTFFIDPQRLTILENGDELFRMDARELGFTQGYLYLQMSSHSNYPAREIYFDNILVRQGLLSNPNHNSKK